ncbi:MAG: M24 family metallopeptidase [Candidatus Obscuribacterales bacterium]|jgi:Xaa-Pro aminopeptidase|nr:M24 family metallopeptidase [Candidatus Obscuribacterales bacterium]
MNSTTEQEVGNKFDLEAIQKSLSDESLDGWLFYFFHDNDDLALRILKLSGGHFTRRWFYFIPAKGSPRKLVHRIEESALDSLPGQKNVYLGWKQLEEQLEVLISGSKRIAMQYSPRSAVPYVSRVDAGTLDLIRGMGAEVVSSADLVSRFEAVWTPDQLDTHIRACENLKSIVFDSFALIKNAITQKRSINEYEVQQFIWRRYEELGMTSNSPCIVAVNEHSGMPHYQPDKDNFSEIKIGDFVLIDLWAKFKEPWNACYADITWTGFVGEQVPAEHTKIFDIVAAGRDAALDLVRKRVAERKTLFGWEVDEAARNTIKDKGYGEYFIHRTGHSIGLEVHANGANMDNLETKEERKVLPNTCFSIEPGVYLKEFGVRSEIDVYVGEGEVVVAASPIQTEIIPILA